VALRKPNGSIRPIAVGEIWRRLTSKVAAKWGIAEAGAFLAPLQVGVGTPGGAEGEIHAITALVQHHEGDSALAIATVDFSNAFNTVCRKAMLAGVRQHAPRIARWVELCYTVPNPLVFGDTLMHSQTGVQQGDPLGSLLFSLPLHPLVRRISTDFPDLLMNAWYLDDGALVGPHAQVSGALQLLQREGRSIGLAMHPGKSEVWWPTMDEDIGTRYPAGIGINRGPGITLLGGALGTPEFVESVVGKRVESIKRGLAALPLFNCPQTELGILRSCMGLPKFTFALRTNAPGAIPLAIAAFDQAQDAAISGILGCGFSPVHRRRMGLPPSMGGLGLPTAASRALPAFLGSVAQTRSIQGALFAPCRLAPRHEFLPLWESFQSTHTTPSPLSLASIQECGAKPQQMMSARVDEAERRLLLASGDARSQALLRCASAPYSGTYLTLPALPQMLVDPRDFRFLLRHRSGIPLGPEGHRTCPCCKQPGVLDPMGDHLASCASSGLLRRHNHVAHALAQAARAAGLQVRLEPCALFDAHRLGGSRERPADVLLEEWAGHRSLCVDVTIVNPLCATYLAGSAAVNGSAATKKATQKRNKYGLACTEAGLDFTPLVVETLGGIEKSGVAFIRALASRLGSRRRAEDPLADIPAPTAAPMAGPPTTGIRAVDAAWARDTTRIAVSLSLACLRALGRSFGACYGRGNMPGALRIAPAAGPA
jgi:hypothetical protein